MAFEVQSPTPVKRPLSGHAKSAREKKRIAAEEIGIDAEFIGNIVESFYAQVRKDELLGPIFADHVNDWPHHLDRMKSFWRSVLHNSGEFSGNPMLKHMIIPGLDAHHFSRWLELFFDVLREESEQSEAVELIGERARSIADSLLTGISIRRDGLVEARAGRSLPHV